MQSAGFSGAGREEKTSPSTSSAAASA